MMDMVIIMRRMGSKSTIDTMIMNIIILIKKKTIDMRITIIHIGEN